jgi:hypothetical protein
MTDTVEIVVVWILCHATIEVRPCQDILSIAWVSGCSQVEIKSHAIASCLFSMVFTTISERK